MLRVILKYVIDDLDKVGVDVVNSASNVVTNKGVIFKALELQLIEAGDLYQPCVALKVDVLLVAELLAGVKAYDGGLAVNGVVQEDVVIKVEHLCVGEFED